MRSSKISKLKVPSQIPEELFFSGSKMTQKALLTSSRSRMLGTFKFAKL